MGEAFRIGLGRLPRIVWSRRSILETSLLCKHQLLFIDTFRLDSSTRFFPVRCARYLLDGTDLDNGPLERARARFVASGDWDIPRVPITDVSVVRRMMYRCDGTSWLDTGEISWMDRNIGFHGSQDGCKNPEDVRVRCVELDRLFSQTVGLGKLLTRRELRLRFLSEKGGIGIGIDRAGAPFWVSGGAHRLGIALRAGLPYIPASLEVIHAEAIRDPTEIIALLRRSRQLSLSHYSVRR